MSYRLWRQRFIYSFLHFWLGFSVGSLTFSSMWITCWLCCGEVSGEAALCIGLFSVSASLVSHVLEDYIFCYF